MQELGRCGRNRAAVIPVGSLDFGRGRIRRTRLEQPELLKLCHRGREKNIRGWSGAGRTGGELPWSRL